MIINRFLEEERAQGAIEYILLAGGVIVAALVITAIYSKMSRSTIQAMNQSVTNVTAIMNETIMNDLQS